MTNHDDWVAEYRQQRYDKLPLWERVKIRIGLFYVNYIYWRLASLLWKLIRYDLFDGRFVGRDEYKYIDFDFDFDGADEVEVITEGGENA